MAAIGTLCSNTFSFATNTPQNIWTTRVLPVGNTVITGFALRDTTGLMTPSGGIEVVFGIAGQTITFAVDNASGSPMYVYADASPVGACLPLVTNPTVTAWVPYGTMTGTVTVDVIGYYI